MIKSFALLLPIVFLVSCASSEKAEIKRDLQTYEFMNHDELYDKVSKIIENHNEYSPEKKEALKKTIDEALSSNIEAKIKESKLAQMLLVSLLTNKEPDQQKIRGIKKQIKAVYKKKYDVFFTTANELKKILGPSKDHEIFIREVMPYINR